MAWKTCVLVVANQTADSEELLSRLKARRGDGGAEFTLLLPAVPGAAPDESRRRLDQVLEAMRGAGLEVEGTIGDCNPLTAIRETWDPAKFDEVVVSTLPTGVSKWLQIDLPHQVERVTGMPCEHVVATPQTAVG
jgi:hypothetical protein